MNNDPLVIGYTRDSKGKVIGRHLKDTSNTLHTGGGTTAQYLLEPSVLRMERTEEEKQRRSREGDKGAKFSAAKQLSPRTDGLSNAITTAQKDNQLLEVSVIAKPHGYFKGTETDISPTVNASAYTRNNYLNMKYRVRKFTPRECFRLMGVPEDYIDLIQASGVSKSQQYKMAGNSIVVDVLFHIFRKMFTETQNETDNYQMDLFSQGASALKPHQYGYDRPLRVVTAFSGYDSQCMALDMLKKQSHYKFTYELIAWSEIDKYAIQAHNAVYPEYADRNLGDIAQIDWSQVPDFDLFTYSFPCTDISSAGLQKGLSENSGTRSGLLWECRKTIDIKRPRFLLMENVEALVQKKFMPEFRKWQEYLASQGYTNFWQVLNAKDYGIPQNRPRVFMVSILDKNVEFHFPRPFPLASRIKNIIEHHVEECYYIKQERLAGLNLSTLKEVENGKWLQVRAKDGE